jgi:hypothetical protein
MPIVGLLILPLHVKISRKSDKKGYYFFQNRWFYMKYIGTYFSNESTPILLLKIPRYFY